MSELPSIRLNLAGEEFEATPENASLYMHLGSLACYNHVFLEKSDPDDNGTVTGSYVFSIAGVFDKMAEYMVANGYPLHVNLRSVAKCDMDAFDRLVKQQAGEFDTIPEGWE